MAVCNQDSASMTGIQAMSSSSHGRNSFEYFELEMKATHLLTWFRRGHRMNRWVFDLSRAPVIEVDSDGKGM